ncbi:hypothetical protein [Sphingobium sp.]|uniref:hypothetical protein n=1 Tax=Sphingobium sp. TaxID=1912891 RepID=UPI002E1AA914
MLCTLGFHRADQAVAWNGGIGFARCRDCATDLVQRPGARWRAVPRGYAVVWRPAVPVTAPAARLAPPAGAPASRDYRHLVRRLAAQGSPRILLLSAESLLSVANDTLLLLAAMLQDELRGRLLLIDATLAEDGISASLGAAGAAGLSDIAGDDPWLAVERMRMLARPDLYLLPAGRHPASGAPDRLAAMLPFLARHFDHLLIQQRSIAADTRNLALATRADCVVLVAEEGRTPMARLHAASALYASNGIAPAGVILAASDPRHGV